MANLGHEGLPYWVAECTEEDLFGLGECAREIWTRYYPSLIGMPQVIYMLNMMYSPAVLARQRESGHIFLKLLDGASRWAGFADVEPWPDGILFLHKFYIQLHLRGHGVAPMLLEAVEDIAHRTGCQRIQLNVNRGNVPALRFYEKHGFKILYAFDLDIGQGFQMNDYRMEKRLGEAGRGTSGTYRTEYG